jgi:hypothetical protein
MDVVKSYYLFKFEALYVTHNSCSLYTLQSSITD